MSCYKKLLIEKQELEERLAESEFALPILRLLSALATTAARSTITSRVQVVSTPQKRPD